MLKEAVLNLLANQGGYLSGEELSQRFKVSRAAIWKAISALRREGFVIDGTQNKGYCLVSGADCLDLAEAAGKAGGIINRWELLDRTDSTNDRLKKMAQDGAEAGMLLVAEEQLAGRGRQGREWVSFRRQGLYFSLLLKPQLAPAQAALLTLVAGLAVAEGLEAVVGDGIAIKWPNDILYHGKKVCGILAEMSAEMEQINYLVLGIGINVNQAPEALEQICTATSLAAETEKKHSRTVILSAVLERLQLRYQQWLQGLDEVILADWQQKAAYLGEDITVFFPNGESCSGTMGGVDKSGGIIIKLFDGQEKTFYSGEVSLRSGVRFNMQEECQI